MPEPYWPKTKDFPLSNLNQTLSLVRVACRYCKRTYHYHPNDLIFVFGDVDVDSLMVRMKCEGGKDHGRLDVSSVNPSGAEAVGIRVRRLVAMKVQHIPVWREG